MMISITKNRRNVIVQTMFAIAFVASGIAVQAVVAQDAGDTAPKVGRVTHLPDTRDTTAENNALLGQVHLFGKSEEDVISALRDGELKRAVGAYRNMAQTAIEIADMLGESQERIGEATVRVELASLQFEQLHDETAVDPAARRELTEDLQVFREMLVARLASLRERYHTSNAVEQESLRKQMAAIATRIEDFDETGKSVADGGAAGVGNTVFGNMKQRLDDVGCEVNGPYPKLIDLRNSPKRLLAQLPFTLVDLSCELYDGKVTSNSRGA